MSKVITAERIHGHDSTWVELDPRGEIVRVQTHPRYASEWRGAPVIVTMACDRYAGYSDDPSRLTDWRVYASEARSKTDDEHGYGAHLTETARSRLGDACRPLALAWVESEAFAERYRRAVVAAIVRHLRDERGKASGRTRELAVKHRDVIGTAAETQILTACDAFDTYNDAVESIDR